MRLAKVSMAFQFKLLSSCLLLWLTDSSVISWFTNASMGIPLTDLEGQKIPMIMQRDPLLVKTHPPSLLQTDKLKWQVCCNVMHQLAGFCIARCCCQFTTPTHHLLTRAYYTVCSREQRGWAGKWDSKIGVVLVKLAPLAENTKTDLTAHWLFKQSAVSAVPEMCAQSTSLLLSADTICWKWGFVII